MGGTVKVDRIDGVGVVALNRPERHNAINDAMAADLHVALDSVLGDGTVRCILLCGEGPSFCSGRDTAELGLRAGGESDFDFVRHHQEMRFRLLDSPTPVVAALHGHVLGGAFEMALSADIRIAADDIQMGFPEIHYGLVADTGGTQLVTPLAGPSKAKYLLMTGERIDAAQALAWGIVDFVVTAPELRTAALDLCRRIAAQSPLALALTKQLVDAAWAESIRSGIRQELVAQVAMFTSADRAEAKAARLDGREPRYTGR